MAPLILHNVPDSERYTGADGIQRPYAVVFPDGSDGFSNRTTPRRVINETGSFGTSRRPRSHSRGSLTPAKKVDPSLQAADQVFNRYFADQASAKKIAPQRKATLSDSNSQPNLNGQQDIDADRHTSKQRYVAHNVPTEVILRGFEENQNYAAISHYEKLAGRICEDYPRDPPLEFRRYHSEIREQAVLHNRPLTLEEKAKVRQYAGGNHWIKVTFESAEAAEAALYSSPQLIMGHLVYAEPYNKQPPTITIAVPASTAQQHPRSPALGASAFFSAQPRQQPSALSSKSMSRSQTSPAMSQVGGGLNINNKGDSSEVRSFPELSESAIDSNHAASNSAVRQSSRSNGNASDPQLAGSPQKPQSEFCRRIPTARRATLLPASQALLPQQTMSQKIASTVPVISWLNRDLIGSQVPRRESGEFDWALASFYWRLCWLLDFWFNWMNGDLVSGHKDD